MKKKYLALKPLKKVGNKILPSKKCGILKTKGKFKV